MLNHLRESFRKLTFRALALRQSPFLDAFRKLGTIFATLGRFDRETVRPFPYVLRTKHSTFRSAITVSYYSVYKQDVV